MTMLKFNPELIDRIHNNSKNDKGGYMISKYEVVSALHYLIFSGFDGRKGRSINEVYRVTGLMLELCEQGLAIDHDFGRARAKFDSPFHTTEIHEKLVYTDAISRHVIEYARAKKEKLLFNKDRYKGRKSLDRGMR